MAASSSPAVSNYSGKSSPRFADPRVAILNTDAGRRVLAIMIKFNALAIVAVAAFAATSAFAGDKAHCAGMQASNDGKMACASYANLNLTAEQKAKMDALSAECHKGGATEATMAKMDKEAQTILNKEQYASWKSAHNKDEKKSEKTQS